MLLLLIVVLIKLTSAACLFLCLCLFDINSTFAVHIQITSHCSCTIGFQMIACFCINIPFLASICCTCWVCYMNHLIAFHIKTFWCVYSKGFTVNIFLVAEVFPLPRGYSFIIILCSNEVINGLIISFPSVTTSQYYQLVIITFLSVCCLAECLIKSVIIWSGRMQVLNSLQNHHYQMASGALYPLFHA